ncbi:AT-rich interactive domain-containing protein 2 isoform X2 [Anopheles merus]|uniref:AT-rich interactive domain-containing protein 2 isoform X2 n=1 Tax=Anopheles merus TaxID=30066 RepID=UPI001BE46562|nr:AT-rich interactive domain-containing protein 2 isoform X2 [Anopheles merus]
MTTDVVKIERTGVPMAIDESTNDASGASFSSVSGGGAAGVGGGGTVAGSAAGTPRESAKSQNLRRTLAKPPMEKDKCSFLNDLQTFHEKHGTPYLKLPKISGKDVDLHKLYSIVIGRGGWMKVNAREDWDEVIEELDLPTRCVNNEIALKQIYIRYLDRYERVNFHGEDKDPAEDEDDEKRLHRRWSVRMLHSTPTVYNHHQHNVPEGLRSSLKLSDDLYRASEYDKLILSLLSPLPNEQDFAINVCTLMSNENKHTLKVDKCPRLVYVLLAHAGVFNHFSLRDTFDEYYSNIRKNSLQRFWKECLFEKPQVLELSLEDCFAKMGADPSALIASIYQQDEPDEEMDGKSGGNDGEAARRADSDFEIMKGRLSTATLRTFLSLGTGLGTNDYIGQRVLQIAAIFRNLSFNEENLPVLGHNRTFIRFLIMCANSRWNNLHHLGLDMLGNIANEIDINDPQSDEVTRCLVSTLSEGLEGADRGVIISCLEVLSKIAQKESNEENLNRCLNQQLYDQISLFLCLNDIMLLLYTLECIYSLTSMGEKPCNAIMHIRGVIDTLVSLVTVEAQSYGPDACILMRVVETIPGNMATHHAQGAYYANAAGQPGQANPPPPTMTQLTVHKDAAQVQGGGQGQVGNNPHVVYPTPEVPKLPTLTVTSKPVPSSPHVPQQPVQQQQIVLQAGTVQTVTQSHPAGAGPNPQIVTVTRPPAADSPQIPVNVIARPDSTVSAAQAMASHQQTTVTVNASPQPNTIQQQQTVTVGGGVGVVVHSPTASPAAITAKHIQQQQAQESEQFAYAWLRASFEAAPAVRMDQQELYKLYLATNGKLGRKVVLPQTHFPRCVRAVFGGTVGPVQLKIEQKGVETVGYYYEGLRLRAKPLPIVHKGTVLTPAVESTAAGTTSTISSIVTLIKQDEQQPNSKLTTPTSGCTAVITAVTTQHAATTIGRELSFSSSTTVSTTIAKPATVISNAGTAAGRTIVSTGQETYRSLEVIQTSLSQATPATSSPGTFRSSSVIAMAPPSSNASTPSAMKQQSQTSGQTVSVLHKTIPTPLQAVKSSQQQTQPRAVLHFTQAQSVKTIDGSSVGGASTPSVGSGGSSTIGKQLIVTQVGGKNVLINKATAGQQHQYIPTTPSSPLLQQVLSSDQKNNVIVVNQTTISPQPAGSLHGSPGPSAHLQTGTGTTTIMNQSGTISSTTTNPSALIKSLLANKVVQRQQMQKQKQLIEQKLLSNSPINPSVVVTSNNPNNLTNIKVGNSTISIKPGTLPTNTVITATNPHETSFNAPPPLAPLSQTGIQQGTIIKTIAAAPHDPSQHHMGSPGGSKLLPNKVLSELLEKKPGEMIIAGETTIKRKYDVTDTSMEPPVKRMEGGTKTADLYAELAGSITEGEDVEEQTTAAAAQEAEQQAAKLKLQQIAHQQQQQQQQQQHLVQQQHQQQQQQQQQQQMITMPVSMQRQIIVTPNSAQPMIISTPTANVGSNPVQQQQQQQLTSQTTATIKTDSGYQTVPIILQHNAMGGGGTLQLQKASAAPGGAIMQSSVLAAPQHPQPTQYILATNPQGQTYVVAQQPQPQPQLQQTVLLAQGQQHGGTGQKTIIIVQQQQPQQQTTATSLPQMTMQSAMGPNQGGQTTQKIFLNQQGQQILMTQLPRQMIVSHAGPSVSGGATIITSSAPTMMPGSSTGTTMIATGGGGGAVGGGGTIIEKKPIYITTNAQGNTISFEGPPQQLQMQTIQAGSTVGGGGGGGTYQIKQYGNVQQQQQQQQQQHIIQQANLSTGGPVGQQTIQFIQQPGTVVQTQGHLASATQSMQPQQIVFQTHGGGTGGGTAQIIQQQIIQAAPSGQHAGQHIVQKVLHQQQPTQQQQQHHLIHTIKGNQTQMITVQQQKQPMATITSQQAQQQPQPSTSQLPSTLSIQRQTVGGSPLSQTLVPPKPMPVPNVGLTVASSAPPAPTPGLPGGKQQYFQVVQQKISPAPSQGTGGGNTAVQGTVVTAQQHLRHMAGPSGSTITSQGGQQSLVPSITVTAIPAHSATTPTTTSTITSGQFAASLMAQAAGLNVPVTTTTSATVSAATASSISTSSVPAVASAQPTVTAQPPPPPPPPIANTITIPVSVATANGGTSTSIQMIPAMDPQKIVEEDVDPSWPWVCDWRGCPRKKFQSATEVFRHACTVHCPDTVDVSADIYCQWGPGPNLCDNLPRKRFSLMTHLLDRHCTADSFKTAVQRRLAGGPQQPVQPYPVTLIRQPGPANAAIANSSSTSAAPSSAGDRGSPAPASCTKVESTGGTSEGSSGSGSSSTNGPGQLSAAGPAAMHAIKRYSMDYVNSKEFQDEMEGPVTKSIRLTSALILRNLVVYTNSAKRSLRMYEAHLAGVALSNVESSRTVAQLLFEMNDTGPNY